MQICGTTIDEAVLGRIQHLVDGLGEVSRTALSRRVCGVMGWKDPTGRLREVSCRIGLTRLGARGRLRLPPAAVGPPRPARRVPSPGAGEVQVARFGGPLAQFGPVELVRVGSATHSRLWNAMMDRYHYLGSGPLCGAQLRYLVRSPEHGWLGGLSWSAPALRVRCRDEWIGWDDWARRQNRDRVVGNSRFLIVPTVQVPHLASHVLGLCARQLPQDWHERYGHEVVLLETFVDEARFRGTCYRAANWVEVGKSEGRGRQDRQHEAKAGVKRVFVYPLSATARRALCHAAVPAPARSYADWTEEEFGRADLGDARLERRLRDLAGAFFLRPQSNLPQACDSRAATKAAYRFFENEQVTRDGILAPHYQATEDRVRREKVVLAVQDTTTLNYTGLRETEGLGPIGARAAADGAIGLMMHDTMAFNPEGTPLGLVHVRCWARPPEPQPRAAKPHQRYVDVEDKESAKWLDSYRAAARLQSRCSDTLVVSVGDREADLYELFELARTTADGPALLVRGKWDRRLDTEGPERRYLMAAVDQAPAAGTMSVAVPRHGGRPARVAELEVRFCRVTLLPPPYKKGCHPQSLWAIRARETAPPTGTEALEWLLLTTLSVADLEGAVEKVHWYARRWGIEIYHRTLKSGCRIEERQLGTADRLEACLAIDLVVAWRIYHLTWLGRETPDVPCSVFFQEAEWKALCVKVTRNPTPPEVPPTLREATRMVASLGGFLGRKCDGHPGTKAIWLGIQRLDDIADVYVLMLESFAAAGYPARPPPRPRREAPFLT
jgi:hypothetical protein